MKLALVALGALAVFLCCCPHASAQTADAFSDYEKCTNGSVMTTTCLGNSTHGGNGSWSNGSQSQLTAGQVPPACSASTVSATQISNLISPVTVSSTLYPGAGSLVANYATNTSSAQQNLYIYTPPGNNSAVGFWICWNMPNTDTGTYDMLELACTGTCGGSRFLIANVTIGSGVSKLELEDQPYGNSSTFTVSPNTPYYIEMSCVAGTSVQDTLKLYNQYGVLQTTLTSGTGTNTHPCNYIGVGSGGDLPQTTGYNWWTDNIVLNYTTGTLPVDLIIPATSGSSPSWTTTPDSASVSSVISSASTGDTIHVSAGIANWSSAISFSNKKLIILGAGPVPAQGIVNTSGTAVTWQYGNQFSTSWTGILTIAGTNYTISSCASTTACTLTTSAGTQTSAIYSTDQSGTVIATQSLNADTCNYPCRFSSFTWALNGTSSDYMQITESTGWQVDNNYFNVSGTANTMLFTYGIGANPTEGLFNHNVSTNGQLVTFGESTSTGGQYRWSEAENAGTQHAVYAEQNFVDNTDGSTGGSYQAFTECNYGCSSVTRFNYLLGGRVAEHGLQGESQDGGKHFEFYNNTFTQPATPNAETLRVRGGTGFIFHNTSDGNELFKTINLDVDRANEDSIASQLGSALWWEFCDGLTTSSYLTTPGNIGGGYTTYGTPKSVIIDGGGTGGWPCRDGLGEGNNPSRWNYSGTPPAQPLVPAYIWRNIESAAELAPSLVCETSGDNLCTNQSSNIVKQNRDWYGYNASNTGATGIGEGVAGSLPATCTTGVGYWATDQGSWNTTVTAGTSGLFYECTATNTWTQTYTPYIYPYSFSSTSFSCSPSTVPAHHSANISLACTGIGTSWTGSTSFSLSGVSGVTLVSSTNNSATSQTLVITTGSSTGTLTISDTTDSISSTILVATATLAISPTSGNTSTTPTLSLTGTNTLWSTETASTLFSLSGGSCSGDSLATPTVSSNTAASAVLTTGSAACTITVTDNSTTATTTFTVNSFSSSAPVQITGHVVVTGNVVIQ